MNIKMNDGNLAHLNGIVQTRDYRNDYVTWPPSAVDEILRIARLLLPAPFWKAAPFLLIGVDLTRVDAQMRAKKLPEVLCVGEFISYRAGTSGVLRPKWLHVVWLQDEMQPHLSESNAESFRHIDWDKEAG